MALTQVKAAGLTADLIDETKLADDSIDSEHYNDGSIDMAHLADGAVNYQKLANNTVGLDHIQHGTDGQILTFDANGAPAYVGPGTDGQVLTSTGAGSPPAFEDAVSEGTQVKSTGESGGTKFLREDGDGTSSWQTLPASGAALTGATDNTVVTVTGANAMQGEANLTFNGSQLDLDTGSGTFNRWKTDQLRFNSTGTAHIDHYTTGQKFLFRTSASSGADTNALEIFSTGDVEVSSGNLVIGTAGKGIDFGATANNGTSTPHEVLDDYEEGTWTPSDGGGIVSYAEAYGQYTKIGRAVYLWFKITCTTSVTDSGNAYIVGLPFTSENAEATGHGALAIGGSNSTDNFMSASTNKNSTVLYLYKDTYGDNMTRAQMWDGASTTKRLTGCFMYCTSS